VLASYDELVTRHAAEHARYARLARLIDEALASRLEGRGVGAIVTSRAKTTRSFVKKAMRKGYADPFAEMPDLAGVRVILYYGDDVDAGREEVLTCCEIVREESKLDALEYDQFGYLGVHLETIPRADFLAGVDATELNGLPCEIQIHTMAQSAWAVVSHDLLYKSPLELPTPIRRGVTRLVATTELFDAEVSRFRKLLRENPDFAGIAALERVDDEIVRLTRAQPDRALTALLGPALMQSYDAAVEEIVPRYLEPFLSDEAEKLNDLYDRYRNDDRHPLVSQPESLLIFERLEHAPDRLKEFWPVELVPLDVLEAMASIWGTDL
jgi:ppGpp synthetase/RelA/SpoT-type nucleotidyltranferase